MKLMRFSPSTILIAGMLPALALAGGTPVPGTGSTFETPLIMAQGSAASTAFGDYTSETGGIDSPYVFWAEVPSGLSTLEIEIFDPDAGDGGAEAGPGRDRQRGGGYTTTLDITITEPDGSTTYTTSFANGGGASCDDAWCNLQTFSNPDEGHWMIELDTSSTANTGDDINAYGIRANDGTPGSGGTEINVYAESFVSLGTNGSAGVPGDDEGRDYQLYPYVTKGCSLETADFDWDGTTGSSTNNTQPYGALDLESRDGSFTNSNATMSANDTWRVESVSGWTSADNSVGYGLFDSDIRIEAYSTGNYGVVYFRAFDADGSEPPPTAQPETNTFRIYFPTDAEGAPSKFYMEQLLTHLSGPNPPEDGMESRFIVTVRIVNPEAQDVTFSASNLVTANIPGSGATYVNEAVTMVSQGSIVSQPADGGTGDLTWNPGTLSAGDTALMAYRVDVNPTSPGQVINITGTPASNGTEATFVDNTGNTSQTRATFTFGPICELSVEEGGTPTVATIVDVQAWRANGGTVLAWSTASEVGSASFEVQRLDAAQQWQTVGVHRAPGVLSAKHGASYQLFDGAAQFGTQTYRIIEREVRGRRLTHGPFDVEVVSGNASLARVSPTQPSYSQARLAPAFEADRIAIQAAERATDNPAEGVENLAWISVSKAGMYRIAAGELASALQLSENDVISRLARDDFSLSLNGAAVTWLNHDDGLVFYGEDLGNHYDTRTRYLLEYGTRRGEEEYDRPRAAGKSQLSDQALGRGALPGAADLEQFMEQVRFEQDVAALTALADAADKDYWYWQAVAAGNPDFDTATLPFDLPDLRAPGAARLVLDLQGASNENVVGEHHLEFRINGVLVRDIRWTGFQPKTVPLDIPAGLLSEAGNELSVTALLADGASTNVVWIDGFSVTYPRHLQAAQERLELVIPSNRAVTIAGFASENIRTYDLTSLRNPALTNGVVSPGASGFDVYLPAAGGTKDGAASLMDSYAPPNRTPLNEEEAPPARYAVVSIDGYQSVDEIGAVHAASAADLGSGADWLVIAPQSLADGAQALANYRAEDGLQTAVVHSEAIYDAFSQGRVSPDALRSFLEYTQVNWAPAPRYVLLAGRGTHDHRNIQGTNDHLLTPMYLAIGNGLAGADPRLVDFGDLGLPALAIGRVPAVNNSELFAYRDKLEIFERSRGKRRAAVAMLADNQDSAGNFSLTLDAMSAFVDPSIDLEDYRLDVMDSAQARDGFLQSLNDGVMWANFVGHGGIDIATHEAVFGRDDVAGLDNLNQMPVVSAFSCLINRSDIPGVSSLGERLVIDESGGSVISWASTSVLPHAYSEVMAVHFAEAMGNASGQRIGDLILTASLAYQQDMLGNNDPRAQSLPLLYNLIGDPAALINF